MNNSNSEELKEIKREFFAFVLMGSIVEIENIINKFPNIVHQINSSGKTGLMLAAYYGHQNICDLLLSKGADVNAVDLDGRMANNYLENIGESTKVELIRLSFKEESYRANINKELIKLSDEGKKADSINSSNQVNKKNNEIL